MESDVEQEAEYESKHEYDQKLMLLKENQEK